MYVRKHFSNTLHINDALNPNIYTHIQMYTLVHTCSYVYLFLGDCLEYCQILYKCKVQMEQTDFWIS